MPSYVRSYLRFHLKCQVTADPTRNISQMSRYVRSGWHFTSNAKLWQILLVFFLKCQVTADPTCIFPQMPSYVTFYLHFTSIPIYVRSYLYHILLLDSWLTKTPVPPPQFSSNQTSQVHHHFQD